MIRERDVATDTGSRRVMLLALKVEERGHKPRNAHGLWKLGKARRQILPERLLMKCTSANMSVLTHKTHFRGLTPKSVR